MNRTLVTLLALTLAVMVALTFTTPVCAQTEKEAAKMDRVSGTVQSINKDTSTITVRDSNNALRQVVYSGSTKITKVNKPGASIDDIKDGTRLICLGKFEKTKLQAARIDIRLPK